MSTPAAAANYRGVFDHQIGFGRSPAIIVIDFIKAYVTPGSPLYAPDVIPAVAATRRLLQTARPLGVPVILTQVLYNKNLRDGGLFVQKVPALRSMLAGEPMAELVDELGVTASDTVLTKQYASAFFGTSLAAMLTAMGIDTLITTGCSTSGCVRATAVDGMQHGFRVIVPRECVADRSPAPHEANLFDINAKYGDVVSLGEVTERLQLIHAHSHARSET